MASFGSRAQVRAFVEHLHAGHHRYSDAIVLVPDQNPESPEVWSELADELGATMGPGTARLVRMPSTWDEAYELAAVVGDLSAGANLEDDLSMLGAPPASAHHHARALKEGRYLVVLHAAGPDVSPLLEDLGSARPDSMECFHIRSSESPTTAEGPAPGERPRACRQHCSRRC
jgi:hypothetical protein